MEKAFMNCCLFFIIFQKCLANFTDKEYALMPPLFHQDNYDNCMLLEDEALYCSFEYHLEPLNQENRIWKIIQEVSADPYNYKHDNLRHSICVPLTCPNYKEKYEEITLTLKEAINECYDKKLLKYRLKGKLDNLKCETNNPKYPVNWTDIVALVFFITYPTLVLICTFCELIAKNQSQEEYQKFADSKRGTIIISLSLIKNWYRLKTVSDTDEVEYLKPLQGVRFYNTILVILSHTALSNTVLPVLNTKYVELMNSKVGNAFLSSGPLCVSTFFLMSSTLLTYGIFTQFAKRKLTKNVLIMIFVNRYIRLAPVMGVIILFNSTLWRHLGRGPNWYNFVGKQYLKCKKNWWTNMIFMNTLIDSRNMCTPTFWYVALDTQYFALLLLLLWFIKNHEKYIWYILASLLSLNIVATFINNYVNNFEALIIPRAEDIFDMKIILENPQWHGQMVSIIGNTAGPILGVGFGYILYKNKNVKFFQQRRLVWQILFYFFSYVPALSIILVPGWYVLVHQPKHDPVFASIIAAIGRPVFISSIAFGIYGCMQNIGGPTGHVLRWPPAYVLGRIAYSAYLVHLTIIISRPATTRTPIYISDLYMMYYLLGDLAASYLVGLVVTLFFEMPVSALQKLLVPTHSRETEEVKKEK